MVSVIERFKLTPPNYGKIRVAGSFEASYGGNFRSQLWAWEEARDYCTQCLPYVGVLLGIEPYLWRDEVFQRFVERYPNLKCIARHVRFAHSGSENSLMAYRWYQGHTFESKSFTFNILDRVGGGGAFASGLICAIMRGYNPWTW